MRFWLLFAAAFNLALLFDGGICAGQSPSEPPRPSPPPPSSRPPSPPSPVAPHQLVPLSLVDIITRVSLCSRSSDVGCMGEQLTWLIDLEPFPLTTGTQSQSQTTGLSCIGPNDTGCMWRSAEERQNSTGSDTYTYKLVGLTIQAHNITRMFQFGHNAWAGYILRQLQTLSISCTAPAPIFALYVLEPLIMAISAAGMDGGQNATAVAAANTKSPPPPPAPTSGDGSSSSPPPSSSSVNSTSDAASNPSSLLLAYSRLYKRPSLGSPLLRSLSIQDCDLTGQLPPYSFWLQLPSLERLDLSRNKLSGPLPDTFGPSPPLSYVNLSHNQISGPLTASQVRYGGCGRTLDLSYNDIRGGLPDAWLSSACTLHGKSSIGLAAAARRWLMPMAESGPDGGVANVASSSVLSYKVAKPLTAVTEGTTPSSSSSTSTTATTSSTTSDAYAFWLSYSTSYMYGGDDCPIFGVAWHESAAARVRNGTENGGDGAAATAAAPFNFTVLLYGNPNLQTPGAVRTGYATAASRFLRFHIRDNACTIFEPLPELLWVWGTFGVSALLVLVAALVQTLLAVRRTHHRVAPEAATAEPPRSLGNNAKRHLGQEFAAAAAAAAATASIPDIGAAAATAPDASGGGGIGGIGSSGREPDMAGGMQLAPSGGVMSGSRSREGGDGAGGGGEEVRAAAAAAVAAADAPAGAAAGGDGGRGMARLIIVAHAQRYSATAVRRLSQYGTALADRLAAYGVWLVYDVPWGPIVHAVVAIAVHLGAAGLTFAMLHPQRMEYCTNVRQCAPRLYFVPPLLSALSIGLTIFLTRATNDLAYSMASRVAEFMPAASGGGGGSGGGGWLQGGEAAKDGGETGSRVADKPTLAEATKDGGDAFGVARGYGVGDWKGGGGGGGGVNGEGSGQRNPIETESAREGTEPGRASPTPMQEAAVAAPAAAMVDDEREPWINGLQPRRGTSRLSPPGSADQSQPAALARLAGSHTLYNAEALPSSDRLGSAHSGIGSVMPPSVMRSSQHRVGPFAQLPRRMESGAAASRHSGGGSPLGSPSGLQVKGGGADNDGSGRVAARGPVAESIESAASAAAAGSGDRNPVASAARQAAEARRNRRGLAGWLYRKPGVAAMPAATPAAPLPASPYGVQQYHQDAHDGRGASGAARARASLQSTSARISRGPCPEFGSSSRSANDADSHVYGGQNAGGGSGTAAVGVVLHTAVITGPGPVAESGLQVKAKGKAGIQSPSGGGVDSDSSDRAEGTSHALRGSSSRRVARRSSPVSALRDTSMLESSIAASSTSMLSTASACGNQAGDGFAKSDSPRYGTLVEPALVKSTFASTHGSRRRLVTNEPDAGDPLMVQQALPVSSVSRSADRPMPSGPSRRGGPWLEDRLAALATLSPASAAHASAAPVGPRMPSVAVAAAVAAATPRRHVDGAAGRSGAALHGNSGTPAGTKLPRLQPEALRVVSQYLRDYTFGKKGSGWSTRAGRTVQSAAIVLFICTPFAPAAAAVALLAALIIIAQSVAGATLGCFGRRARHRDADAGGKFDHFVTSLRLFGNLFLSLHLHVAAWVICAPLAIFTGMLYGLGYLWGSAAVPLPWLWLACNSACLAGLFLMLLELVFQMPAWEYGVCRYPYVIVLQSSTAFMSASTAPGSAAAAVAAAGAARGDEEGAASWTST